MAKPKVKGKTKRKDLPSNFFPIFKKEALIRANDTSRKFSKEIVKEAKAVIRQQKYDWVPLSEGYAKYKEREGLDPRTLIATKDYVNNGIGVQESQGFIFVGPKTGIHKPSGVPYRTIAKWFEYGTWTMPARPLWRPLLSSVIRKQKLVALRYRQATAKALKKKLKQLKVKQKKV